MSDTRRPTELRANLRAIYLDGVAYSLMVGMGETYIPAFAVALGLSSVLSGLVATLPMLAGALLQLFSTRIVERLGSHRRFVILCVGVQAASFLPLVVAALLGHVPAALLYLFAALYWAAGMAANPAWNVWVQTLVPRRMRIHYFAVRSRALHIANFVGMFCAGWILDAGVRERIDPAGDAGTPLYGFAIIFAFAALWRSLSTAMLARQTEPVPMPPRMRRVAPMEVVRRFRHGRDGRLLAYMFAVQFAWQVASPYFTPYMLGPLRFSYAEYMQMQAAAVFVKFVSLPMHGWIARRFGVRALLWVGGIGIVPTVLPWLFSENYGVLLAGQLVSGVAWSAYELATFLLFFDAIDPSERTSVLSTYNLGHALATAIGSLAGGFLLHAGDATAFRVVFATSCALRLATIFLLRRVEPGPVGPNAIARGAVAVLPSDAPAERPLLPRRRRS